MASALSTFNDFVSVTGPAYLTSAEDVINEAVKNNYLLRRFLKGADMTKVIQGGSVIRDSILFDEDSTFQFYQPNETFTWANPQVIDEWEINWRFAVDHMSWTDQEIELNIGSGLSQSARFHQYKRLKRIKEQRLWTSVLNGMEDQLFAVPEVAKQETNTGEEPYSIPAFVNEETNGLFGGVATGAPGAAWTTVEGINPVTESRWVPQQVTYTQSTTDSADGTLASNNVIGAFDDMFLSVKFDVPPTKQEYFESPKLYAQFIACSKAGQNHYRQLLRASQDTFVTASRQDPSYMKPQYAGIDLEYVANLDTAALYSHSMASSALQTEQSANADDIGPRYYWLNGAYLCPVFHSTRYMTKHPVMTHPNQPFTHIMPVDTWYNMVCRSRQRLGIVRPLGDIVTA